EVNNRGSLAMLARFNRAPHSNDPADLEDAGNGFLLRQGYTLAWSAWNWDVLPGGGRLQIDLPVATDGGRPVTGRLAAEIVVSAPSAVEPFAWGNSRGYEAVDGSATLTVRDHQRAARTEVPRGRWRLADATHLELEGGFEPGRIYELVYTARDPRVVGLGLAAIRDTLSFLRFSDRDAAGNPNPLARAGPGGTLRPDAEKAYAFGISQSGRVIQHMLLEGFHVDEAGRMAFDAAMVHVAGGGKGSFNHRFAQTTRHPSQHEDHQYPADVFPFGVSPQTDPLTGETGDVLAAAKAMGKVPHVFYTGTSTEYWTRSASLVHTDVTGTRDTPLDPRVRLYAIAGAQHGIAGPYARREYEHPVNRLDHSPPLRALLVALDRWATTGAAPPDSAYPRIDRGELVAVAEWRRRFPAIPGVRLPGANLAPPRLDLGPRFRTEGVVDRVPPAFGAPYVTLVPQVDADGNERGGIRLPEVAAPLGAYAGWNLRRAEMGAPEALGRWDGSFFPFAPTEAERRRRGDPRPSLEARYPSQADYVERVAAAARALRRAGFLLEEDVAGYAERARAMAWPPAGE
ncbi:MAG TPA: alpha/beta hydrolase domain-containing protein, partial [Vicinamibacteria bacterium]|nr:alpha/beta hydrolase domain-containing protein [Vicinamibacteria bacterium]